MHKYENQKKIFFFYFLIALALTLIINIAIIRLEPNPITLNNNLPTSRVLNDILPQGWAFFTKDVNDGYYKIYEVKDYKQNIIEEIKIKSSSNSQLFGIIRANRTTSSRILYISNNINKKLWYETSKKIETIDLSKLSIISIKVKQPMIYGKFLICKGKPLPYEWYKSKIAVQPIMSYLILDLKR